MSITKPRLRGRFIAGASVAIATAIGCGDGSPANGGPGGFTTDGGAQSDGGTARTGGRVDSGGGAKGDDGNVSSSGGSSSGGSGEGGAGPGSGDASEAGGTSGGDGGTPKLPCDIYGEAGTGCVAAHSTTRALFGAYGGKLYQVQRSSDHATRDIGTVSPGGYADAAAQDAFCADTACTITIIYDQSSKANHLTISPGGGFGKNPDVGANASQLPVIVGGRKAYGVYVSPGTGYRNLSAKGTARNGQPEGMYMVTSGKHVNNGCCFDYGNTEQPLANDTGNGHMDAVYFGTRCEHPPCSGGGPWIAADLENGLFQGNGSNTHDAPVTFDLVTAMLKNNGQTTFSLKTANAQTGALTTQYDGTLPTANGYIPMKQEGGIVLGVGGDNSNGSAGDFYEGLMTYGYPTDAAEEAVQANIVSVGYGIPAHTAVVPTSESSGQTWKYTTTAPASSWNQTSFDDGGWSTGSGGFGTTGTPGAVIGTTWNTPDIWLRRSFSAGNLTTAQLANLILRIHHDEDAEIYVNGVPAASLAGFTQDYGDSPLARSAQSAIVPNGNNVLSVHCHNTAGGQFIDVGIYLLGT